ncbi:uncharacterized protein Z520_05846 [Fonsecaea multimorphosa CBS 102226]|uniref:Uncharacterized protein n=1 Tax=Fonsecaea multimorphosa CBS 102226 TaxID=1442371 RepID=A0A0D2H9K1_9EURO|nr:uncharacterized protein Z520_05846 [Fonsecaea multimorphosa CBS 102226]KIX98545.1 hypothetical protein Z520_05846 [Fonsecaea multimorphosa CBS 102226]OAL24737.1 hypothetical protein AYO22_05526 [Fonsecaea multimorphosa]
MLVAESQHHQDQASWGKTRQNLLQQGSLSRFRLGTLVQRESRRKAPPTHHHHYAPTTAQPPPRIQDTGQLVPISQPDPFLDRTFLGPVNAQQHALLQEEDEEVQAAAETVYIPSKLLRTVLDTYRREMFASFPRIVRGPELEVLDEYINLIVRDELPFKVIPGIRAVSVSFFFPISFQHQGLFECTMATARGMFESRRTPPPFKPSTAVFGQRARAIRSVRDLLSQPASLQDDRALIGVMQLMGTHIITGDIVSFQSHHKAVKQMIELRGGLGDTDAHRALRGFLGMNEMFALMLKYMTSTMPAAARPSQSTSQAPSSTTTQPPPNVGQTSSTLQRPGTTTQQPPSPPPAIPQLKLDYPVPPFSEHLNRMISRLPPGLAALSLTGTISTQMIALLAQTAPWAALTAGTPNPSATVSQSDIYRLYCEPMETARAALSILLALPRISDEPKLEHALCIGLCLSIRGARNTARPPALHIRLLADFGAVVRSLMTSTSSSNGSNSKPRPLSQPEQDAVVWISFLAAYGSGHPAFQRQVDDLLDLVLRSYSYGGPAPMRDWGYLESLLRGFFWFEPLGDDWRELWHRVCVTRMPPVPRSGIQ